MRKLTLSEWAQVGELIAALAVVVSLLLVVYSLERNTAALQGGTENLIFETHTALVSHFISDASLAAVRAKVRRGENLDEVEATRWETYQTMLLDIWAMAHARHAEGLLSDPRWDAWDGYFIGLFQSGDARISPEYWEDLRFGFDADFWAHVNGSVFGK
jgi:hypothetical protein